MKIFKLNFIFVLLFLCVCSLSAQIMETVSYTPSKSGNYGTITTKSLAVFSGDLSVANGDGTITGLGEKLTFDAKGFGGTKVGAISDVYSSVSGTAGYLYIAGKLNTATDTMNISNIISSSYTTVYGGDTDFETANIAIAQKGIFEINDVNMRNPNCNIKWIKLPAFRPVWSGSDVSESSTANYYWFAYCDSDVENVEDWIATVENFEGVAVCKSGLDQQSDCTYEYGNNALGNWLVKSHFTCTEIQAYSCTSSIVYYTPSIKSGCENNIQGYYYDSSANYGNGWCSNKLRRYPAAYLSFASAEGAPSNQEVYWSPVIDKNCSDCPANFYSECCSQRVLEYNKVNKLSCGFSDSGEGSPNFTSYGADAHNHFSRIPSCSGLTTVIPCWEKANVPYDTYAAWLTKSNADICKEIYAANGVNVGTSFSCAMGVPAPNKYGAFRVANCINEHRVYRFCANGTCSATNGHSYCQPASSTSSGIDSQDTTVYVRKKPGGSWENTTRSLYVPQKYDGKILTCEKE